MCDERAAGPPSHGNQALAPFLGEGDGCRRWAAEALPRVDVQRQGPWVALSAGTELF